MTAEPSNARGELSMADIRADARAPLQLLRERLCNNEEGWSALCQLMPMLAAAPPAAARGDVPYDRDLIARMLDVCGHPKFTLEAYMEQARLLREADNAAVANVGTVAARGDVRGLVEALVREIERNACMHEETHRSGAIWEICRQCGAQWADDEGGRPEFKWPECVESAREWLAAEGVQAGEVEPDGYTSYGEFRWACDCDERQRREWTPVYLAPPSAPVGVEDMHDDLPTPDLLAEAERIAANQFKDGRYAAARVLRILCHRLAQQPAAVDGVEGGS